MSADAWELFCYATAAHVRRAQQVEDGLRHHAPLWDLPRIQPAQGSPAKDDGLASLFSEDLIPKQEDEEASVPSPSQGVCCVACQDPIPAREIRAPCGHSYDPACLLALFEVSTRDESLFPPRCCTLPIPLRLAINHMTTEFSKLFFEKSKEYSTPKRVYCAKPSCSRFLGPQVEGTFVTARILKCTCGAKTCPCCKELVQHGAKHACKVELDAADRAVLALVEREGWARCPGCGALVERTQGCDHMVCKCRTNFCYQCKMRRESCRCNSARARARAVPRRRVPRAPSPPSPEGLAHHRGDFPQPILPPPVPIRTELPVPLFPLLVVQQATSGMHGMFATGSSILPTTMASRPPYYHFPSNSVSPAPRGAARNFPEDDSDLPRKRVRLAEYTVRPVTTALTPTHTIAGPASYHSQPEHTSSSMLTSWQWPLSTIGSPSSSSSATSPTSPTAARVRECQNHRWQYFARARGTCRYCTQSHGGSLFQCPGCGVSVCQGCTRISI